MRYLAPLLLVPLAGTFAFSPSAYAENGPLLERVEALRTADGTNKGYDRDLFGYDSTSTRADLIDQERTPAGWYSPWTDRTHSDVAALDVDHTVALAEAWRSGASEWTDAERKAYANDLGYPYTLNLIESSLNRGAKSDNDPFEWVPEVNVCEYVKQWTGVKIHFDLAADGEEKMRLAALAQGCDGKKPEPKPSPTSPSPTPTDEEPPEASLKDPLADIDSPGESAALVGFGVILIGACVAAYAMLRKGGR